MLGGYETKESSTKRKDERNNVNLPSKHKQKERDAVIMKKNLSWCMYIATSNMSFITFHY